VARILPEEKERIWITACIIARMPAMAGIINNQKCTFTIMFIDKSGEMSVNLSLRSLFFLYAELYYGEIVRIFKYFPKSINLVDSQL
jgi:hypothetical protein